MDTPVRRIVYAICAYMALVTALASGPAGAAAPLCAPNGAEDMHAGDGILKPSAPGRGALAFVPGVGAGQPGRVVLPGARGMDAAKDGGQVEAPQVVEPGFGWTLALDQQTDAASFPAVEGSRTGCNPARARRIHELMKSLLYWPVQH
jgi:hypothetical protein